MELELDSKILSQALSTVEIKGKYMVNAGKNIESKYNGTHGPIIGQGPLYVPEARAHGLMWARSKWAGQMGQGQGRGRGQARDQFWFFKILLGPEIQKNPKNLRWSLSKTKGLGPTGVVGS